jgi:hypothetical protein
MTERNEPDPFTRFIGLILMGAAALWMAFCGLCAFGVMATVVTESAGVDKIWSTLLVLAISGAAAAGGYAVFIAGRSLWR